MFICHLQLMKSGFSQPPGHQLSSPLRRHHRLRGGGREYLFVYVKTQLQEQLLQPQRACSSCWKEEESLPGTPDFLFGRLFIIILCLRQCSSSRPTGVHGSAWC